MAEYFAGIDLGSTMTKTVIIDQAENICAFSVRHTGAEHRRQAGEAMAEALQKGGIALEDIAYVVATGYGRINVPFADKQITELSCHARGLVKWFPHVRLAIDIGGQDSKGMQIQNGKLEDFVMNDKCAAGTGRFLEVLASTLGIKVEDLAGLSSRAKGRAEISSPCTVFVRQEVADLLSRGTPIEDIVAGLHYSIASKVAQMVKRLKIEPDVVFTGGVARNSGVVKALEECLQCRLLVPDEPLLSGAFGAALLARESRLKEAARETSPRKLRQLGDARFFN